MQAIEKQKVSCMVNELVVKGGTVLEVASQSMFETEEYWNVCLSLIYNNGEKNKTALCAEADGMLFAL